MPISDFAYTLELDLNNDGTFESDQSAFFIGATISRGRQDALSRLVPGEMVLELQNRTGQWSPDKGTLSGLDLYTPVRLYATWTTPAVTNLDEDPAEMRAPFSHWAAFSGVTLARETADSWTTNQCQKLGAPNFDAAGADKYSDDGLTKFTVSASLPYTWRVRAKSRSGAKNLTISIRWFTSGDVFISAETKNIAISNDWQPFFVTGTSPGTAARAVLRVVTNGAQGAFDFLVDAGMFYESATLLPYVDGRQPGCTWSGTADESRSSRSANPTFLLFEGFIFDFNLDENITPRIANIVCRDRLALLREQSLSLGGIGEKKAGMLLDRVLDILEVGEEIANTGNEFTNNGAASLPNTGWSNVGSGSLDIISPGNGPNFPNDFDLSFEGDWWVGATITAAAGNGVKYNLTTDIDATGEYTIVTWARLKAGQASTVVKFDVQRDSSSIASVTKTITSTAWTRVELPFDMDSLGTLRELHVTKNATEGASRDIRLDGLHCVLDKRLIKRSIDAGQSTLAFTAAYREPAGPVIDDIVDSDPGQLYVEAKTITDGGRIIFHDNAYRATSPFVVFPRLVLGDGDGLLGFAADRGFQMRLDARDRVSTFMVTSRGTPAFGPKKSPVWSLSPTRDLASGDLLFARYAQPAMSIIATAKEGTSVEHENRNFNVGADVDILTTATDASVVYAGTSLEWPSDVSMVRKADATATFLRELTVPMPLQKTVSADMATEAQRLIDKYKNLVRRPQINLTQQEGDGGDEDLIRAFQLDLDIDEQVIVRATEQSHSPNVKVRCWVEGINTTIRRTGKVETTVLLEEV